LTAVFGIGLFLGNSLEIEVYRRDNRESLGLPTADIRSFNGQIAADSRKTSGGNVLFRFEVSGVEDRRGNRSSCRSELPVIFPTREKFYWGEKLIFRGKALPGNDGGLLIIASPGGLESRAPGGPFFEARAILLARTEKVFGALGGPWGGLLEALLLGIQDDLPSVLKESFLRAGVVHILALSGMHLGILVIFISLCFRPLFGPRGGDLLSVAFTVLYVLLVGPKASLLRACFMVVPFLLLRTGGRRPESFTLFSLSFITMALFFTEELNSLSFHLSFLAMGGILVFTPPVKRLVSPLFPEPALSPLAVSLAAQFTTAPLQVLRFGVLYPAGFVSSVFLAPLITIFIALGLVSCAVLGLFPESFILRYGLQFLLRNLYTAILMVVDFFSLFPVWKVSSPVDRVLFGTLMGAAGFYIFPVLSRTLKRDRNDSL
jgi:competence protein ComEC